jgi:hypothetical protein
LGLTEVNPVFLGTCNPHHLGASRSFLVWGKTTCKRKDLF